jgi:hypothetical protein
MKRIMGVLDARTRKRANSKKRDTSGSGSHCFVSPPSKGPVSFHILGAKVRTVSPVPSDMILLLTGNDVDKVDGKVCVNN